MNLFQSAFHKIMNWISAKEPDDPVDQRIINRTGWIPVKGKDLMGNNTGKQKQSVSSSAKRSDASVPTDEEENQNPQVAERPVVNSGYSYPQDPNENLIPFPGAAVQTSVADFLPFVEYVVMLKEKKECRTIIEYMKENASVFVNMEFIASENERQRCVDVLSGASYTLGCKMNKLSSRGMYLISSPNVNVILDSSMQNIALQQDPSSSQMLDSFRRVQPSQMYADLQARSTFSRRPRASYSQGSGLNETIPAQDYSSESVDAQPFLRMRGGTPTERFQSPAFQRPEGNVYSANPYMERMAQGQ